LDGARERLQASERQERCRHHARMRGRVAVLGVALAALAVFVALTAGLGQAEVAAFDGGVLRAVERLHTAAATVAMRGLALLGGYAGASILSVTMIVVLIALRHRRQAAFAVAVMAGSGLLQYVTKLVFARPRPSVFPPLEVVASYAYPSGHAMTAASLALVLAVICWGTRWRWAALGGGLVFTVAVSLTRLYLGVHYPSDLLGGWCLAATWTVFVWLAFDVAGYPVRSGTVSGAT
jgi:undecaprenyl-diphosphatase